MKRSRQVFLMILFLIVFLSVFTATSNASEKPEVFVQLGHSKSVDSVAFSPDDRYALSGSWDKTIKLWDVATGREVRTFAGHSKNVTSVAFSPDGRCALSGSWDKTIKLWDVATGREMRIFKGHRDSVDSVAFSPDGRCALSGSSDETVKLWDVETGREIRTFKGHQSGVTSVAFSPDGRYALSGSWDKTLKLWDVATGREVRTFAGHSKNVTSVAFSPDGRCALSGSWDKTIKLWDVATGREIRTFKGHQGSVDSVAFSPDGRCALSGSFDKTVKLWDVETGRELRVFKGHSNSINCVKSSSDGRYVLSGSGWRGGSTSASDNMLKLWDVETGREIKTFEGHTPDINLVTFCPDNRYMLWGIKSISAVNKSFNTSMTLWDVATGREVRTYKEHSGHVNSITFSPDGTHILSRSSGRTLSLCDVETGNVVRVFEEIASVIPVAFSPDGKFMLSGNSDKTLTLWDVETGREARIFKGHPSSVTSVAFSPDGRYALSGSSDKTVKLWDVATGKEVRTFAGHSKDVTSVAFSPDGRCALSGSSDETVKLWDVETGREIRTFKGHQSGVTSVAFSPDGRYALSGSWDKTIKLWDVATGKEVRTFAGHSEVVTSVAFSPNGKHVLSGSGVNRDRTLMRLWNVKTGKEMRIFQDSSVNVTTKAFPRSEGVGFVAFSPDGRYALSGNGGNRGGYKTIMTLWDVATGKRVRDIKGHSMSAVSVAFSLGGDLLSGCGDNKYSLNDNLLTLWDAETGKKLRTFEKNHIYAESSFSPNGRYVLSGRDKTLKLWDVATGREVRVFKGHSKSVTSVAFSPDGRYALSGSLDKTLKLWDVETGREVLTFKGDPGVITSVAFSRDGRYVLSGNNYGTIKLWDMATSSEVRTFAGHLGAINYIAFSPDGRYVLAGSGSKTDFNMATTKLLDVATGREVRTFAGHPGSSASVVFDRDGKYILLSDMDGAVRLRDVNTGREIAMFVSFWDGEWVVMTPEGYFNASKNGAQYINVRVGNTVYGLDQFYDVFYRPDIVQSALKGEDITKIAALNLEDALRNPPPAVELRIDHKDSSRASLRYTVKSTGGGIGDIRIFHNGKLIRSDGYYRGASGLTPKRITLASLTGDSVKRQLRGITETGNKSLSIPTVSTDKGELYEGTMEIDAVHGENEVSIAAFNRTNTVQGMVKTESFTSSRPPEVPRLYILAVGADRYRDRASTLRFAVRDAEGLASRIVSRSGTIYRPENVHSVILKDTEATKENILGKASELAKVIRPSDGFVLIMAGHGVLVSGVYSVVTHDFDGTLDTNVLITSNELMEISKNVRSLNQLFILDTCHAGGLDNFLSGLYDARMTVLAKNMGLHMYASAGTMEGALDGYKGNGLFTYSLLDGLNNNTNADTNKDKKVSVEELGRYAKENTVAISKKIGFTQNPLIINFGRDNPVYMLKE